MESLQQRLFNHKSIPYICKKYINDEISDYVLRHTDRSFHRTVLPAAVKALDTLCVLKGGAAAAVYTKREEPLTDLDIEVYVDDARATTENLHSFVSMNRLEKCLKDICEQYYEEIDNILESVNINRLMNNNYARNNMIIFKSYVNEAIEIVPDRVSFHLNKSQPFKSTVSMVNEDYYLVRYSFNVHMKSKDSIIWLHKNRNRIQSLNFFPLDVYFLDLSVKRSPAPYVDMYTLATLFECQMYVENLKYLIADQLECLLFNVFNHNWHKIENRVSRIRSLLLLQDQHHPVEEKTKKLYEEIMASDQRFNIRDVKKLLYMLGPIGPRALIELYFLNRFENHVKYVTHQVNFPYHRWQPDYFSRCWKQYLGIVNRLYKLNYSIESQYCLV
ncbi:se34 [Alphabaculovirus alterspexiguae]|uniref:Se34 n=1 Tax=Spodoptera exigua multiple nucleopolyhedrovirus TaxID=10454 RepID=A0A3G2JTX5_9ABAC|nr:se34 [Spodoptera exigua multiple nucleopolyhedrovirus]AYN44994.1 se34 [Spodoptera exigua multiple nucleopolyhedrovirus]